MSNLVINIRFGTWHFQVARYRPFIITGKNPYHEGWPYGWFEIHQFFGYHGKPRNGNE